MTNYETFERIARGGWSITDTAQFLSGFNRHDLLLILIDLSLMQHSKDPAHEVFQEPHAKRRLEGFRQQVEFTYAAKEKAHLLSIPGLSDEAKHLIRSSGLMQGKALLNLPLEEFSYRDLGLINGRIQPKETNDSIINVEKIIEVAIQPLKKVNKKKASEFMKKYASLKKSTTGYNPENFIEAIGWAEHSRNTQRDWMEKYDDAEELLSDSQRE